MAHKDKEKKAWVAIEKKAEDAGDEDGAVVSEGYSGGDEGDDLLELDGDQESEHEGGNHRVARPDQLGDVRNSLAVASVHECPDGGSERSIQVGGISTLDLDTEIAFIDRYI